MLKIRVIPCLDVDNGRVVKGVNFVDLIDAGDPVEQARLYCREGADELCFLDITATSDQRNTLLDVVARVAEEVFIPLTVGGGVRTIDDIRALLEVGVDKVAINSAAIKDPDFVKRASDKFGSQAIVVAIDAKQVPDRHKKWQVYSHGGRQPVGLDAVEWALKMSDLGAGELLVTSMDRDGTRAGFDLGLLKAITSQVSVPVIASGGVGVLDHLVEGVRDGGASAVLAASIFHFGDHTINQSKLAISGAGLPVRLSSGGES